MSSEKISDLFIEEVIRRVKKECSIKDEKDVADLIGISPQNFSKKKTQKSVINDIFKWAILNDKDLNLLFKGEANGGVDIRSEQKRKYEYLEKIDEWIAKKLSEDSRNKDWFEIEFEKFFPEFKKWKEEKEESEEREASIAHRKVA
jgi:hypothetical protein